MKKYELLERTAEIRDRNAIVPGCTANVALSTPGYDDEPEKLESFDSLEEAKKLWHLLRRRLESCQALLADITK